MTFYLRTYGCQMNQNDSELIAEILHRRGMEPASSLDDADLLIVNTCSVRAHAERRAGGFISMVRKWKQERTPRVLCVVGCMSQRRGHELLKQHGWIDVVAGPDTYERLPDYVDRVVATRTRVCDLGLDGHLYCGVRPSRPSGVAVQVSIMRGCDNFCSYCVVPFLRGRARSRAVDDVLEEITGLVAGGAKEVMLLGQNVNAYSSDGVSFRRLLELVNGVQGLQRIRFLTSHPASMDAGILETMAALDKVCEFMHLPLQSGSDRILGLMNRHYTAVQYRRLIDDARRTIPDLALSTDVIVGFPTETDEDYHATRNLMQDVGFDTAYMFKYSPHPETASYELEPQVEEGRAQARLDEIIAIQNEITRLKNQALIGRSVEVLVEGPSRDGRHAGRTRNNKSIVFDGNAEIGQLATVAIDRLSGWTPAGRVVERFRGS